MNQAPGARATRLAGLVEALAGASVLVVGDVMLDRYVYGDVERISPEAPIPVLRVARETAMPGGAGNVARNLAALGGRPHLVAAVGDDAAGRELGSLVADMTADLVRVPGRPTTVKTRYIAERQQLLRADAEDGQALTGAHQRALIEAATAALEGAAAVVLSDYGKGVLGGPVLSALIAAAGKRDTPVIVDPMGEDYGVYRGADLLTPNRRELQRAAGMEVSDVAGLIAAARKVIAECGVGGVLATRGGEGMTLVPATGEATHLPTMALEVFDVSGAGDTVVAALACALAAGVPLLDAVELANLAAGIVVGKVGTAVARAEELKAAALRRERETGEAKVMTLDALLERAEGWRRRGRRIAFTNGCFDLLHPGHVSLLEQAKAACDRLVVGLNTDASARVLKGPGRPVQSETARATVLASLASVDAVVLFAEPTPLTLIEAIRPEVLVKGADYALDQVVGADIVRGYGGKILLARLEEGHSTTATIARIAD